MTETCTIQMNSIVLLCVINFKENEMKIKYTTENLKTIYYIFKDEGSCRRVNVFCNECPIEICEGKNYIAYKEAKKILRSVPKEDLLELGISLIGG